MQKNLYFRQLLRRNNIIEDFLKDTFQKAASYPRLFLEVFTRKNFGERYFRLHTAVFITIVLAVIPYLLMKAWPARGTDPQATAYYSYRGMAAPPSEASASPFSFSHFVTWYLYLAGFLYLGIQHARAQKRSPSVYDFERYSLANGVPNPAFYRIPIGGKRPSLRQIETIIEPLAFFLAGLVLVFFRQYLGLLLMFCAVIYCLSYLQAYSDGDNFVLDRIDEMIVNQEMKKAFVDGVEPDRTKGFRFLGRVPGDHEKRQRLLPLITSDDDAVEVL